MSTLIEQQRRRQELARILRRGETGQSVAAFGLSPFSLSAV
jgi:hypothetical protein